MLMRYLITCHPNKVVYRAIVSLKSIWIHYCILIIIFLCIFNVWFMNFLFKYYIMWSVRASSIVPIWNIKNYCSYTEIFMKMYYNTHIGGVLVRLFKRTIRNTNFLYIIQKTQFIGNIMLQISDETLRVLWFQRVVIFSYLFKIAKNKWRLHRKYISVLIILFYSWVIVYIFFLTTVT